MASTPERVAQLMTRDVCSVDENDDLLNLLETMQALRFRHTPVTATGGALVGLLSERDMLKMSASTLLPHARQQDKVLHQRFRVGDVMNREIVTVHPDTPLREAGELLLKQRIGCLPVVDDANRIVGIITTTDFLRLGVSLLPRSPDSSSLSPRS